MEETPTAPVAEEPAKSEAPSNTPQETPAKESTAPAEPQKDANVLNLTEDQKKFFESNGGFEKVFEKMKSAISNPAPKQEQAPAPTPAPEQAPVQAPAQDQPVDNGYMTPQKLAALQYRDYLKADNKYANIKDYISKGDFIKDMVDMGMTPVDARGNFNDPAIHKFLDLKSASMPAVAPSAPDSTTPTAGYTQVADGAFTDMAQAMKVYSEAGNPQRAAAEKYIKDNMLKNFGK